MRTGRILAVFGIVALFAACEPTDSMHPLFTEKDRLFEPALVGTWSDKRGKPWCKFEKAGENAYKLLLFGGEGEPIRALEFEAHLMRLGPSLFLDIYPEKMHFNGKEERLDDFFGMVPTHTFYRLEIDGDFLQYAFLDDEWVKSMIRRKKLKLPHVEIGGDVVLTATTKDLQKLVLKYARDNEAFPVHDDQELHRLSSNAVGSGPPEKRTP